MDAKVRSEPPGCGAGHRDTERLTWCRVGPRGAEQGIGTGAGHGVKEHLDPASGSAFLCHASRPATRSAPRRPAQCPGGSLSARQPALHPGSPFQAQHPCGRLCASADRSAHRRPFPRPGDPLHASAAHSVLCDPLCAPMARTAAAPSVLRRPAPRPSGLFRAPMARSATLRPFPRPCCPFCAPALHSVACGRLRAGGGETHHLTPH